MLLVLCDNGCPFKNELPKLHSCAFGGNVQVNRPQCCERFCYISQHGPQVEPTRAWAYHEEAPEQDSECNPPLFLVRSNKLMICRMPVFCEYFRTPLTSPGLNDDQERLFIPTGGQPECPDLPLLPCACRLVEICTRVQPPPHHLLPLLRHSRLRRCLCRPRS